MKCTDCDNEATHRCTDLGGPYEWFCDNCRCDEACIALGEVEKP